MGLREALDTRGLPQATYPLRAVPSEQLAAARDELADATAALAHAEANHTVSTALRRRVDDATAAVDACFHRLTLRALPPAEMEALVLAHPAGDEQPGQPFNRQTLMPALLAACVYGEPDATEPALTESEWAAQIAKGSGSLGEVAGLFNAVWMVNDRTPDVGIPKGSTAIRR